MPAEPALPLPGSLGYDLLHAFLHQLHNAFMLEGVGIRHFGMGSLYHPAIGGTHDSDTVRISLELPLHLRRTQSMNGKYGNSPGRRC